MFINNYGVDSETMTWLMLRNLNQKGMPFKLQNLQIGKEEIHLDTSALLTFNSFEKLRAFNKKLVLTNEYYRPLQLFVYCQKASIDEIKSLTLYVNPLDFQHIIQFEYFVVDQAKFVRLMTFVWYSPGKCRELQLIEVNKFDKLTQKWENGKFLFEKLKNFHKCLLHYTSKFLNAELTGFARKNVQQLRKHLNYRLNERANKSIPQNERFYGVRGCYNSYDIFHKLSRSGGKKNFIAWPVEYEPSHLAAPPSEYYSEYEKLIMPFDCFTWALIALTFAASFGTVLILYCVKRSIRDFIIGSNVKTPSLNIVQIFFGISQVVVPRRNFARFLTMLFVLYCLIIRTAWQGKMYEFMQKDISKPEIQTIEEMIEQKYVFYMFSLYTKQHPESEITKRGNVKSQAGFDNEKIFRSDFKGVLQTDILRQKNIASETKKRIDKRIRKEVLYTTMCGMMFPPNHHYVGIFDLKSQQLFTAGIIKHLTMDEENYKLQKELVIEEPVETKILNMHMLEPGFVIWSTSLTFTLFAFVLEWLNTLKNYFVFKYIFKSFFRALNGSMH